MSDPTFLIEWRDGDSDPEGDNLHSIEYGTPADVLGVLSGAYDGRNWDVSILQNDAETGEKAA